MRLRPAGVVVRPDVDPRGLDRRRPGLGGGAARQHEGATARAPRQATTCNPPPWRASDLTGNSRTRHDLLSRRPCGAGSQWLLDLASPVDRSGRTKRPLGWPATMSSPAEPVDPRTSVRTDFCPSSRRHVRRPDMACSMAAGLEPRDRGITDRASGESPTTRARSLVALRQDNPAWRRNDHRPTRPDSRAGRSPDTRADRGALPAGAHRAPDLHASSPTRRSIPAAVREALDGIGPDDPHPLNLFRVHWHNGANRTDFVDVPDHLVLPPELTGVEARIVLALGNRFPLIEAHKVLAAYGCLAPRLVTGQFDPTSDRAVWPSTGNYCRGGVAISRLLGCHGVAVLPEGMSRERFAWLEQLGGRAGRHRPDARHREQRQGDLRQVPRARRGSGQRHPQPVRRVREPHRPLPRDRRRARARVRVDARAGAGPAAAGLRLRDGLRRHDRRRRLPQGAPRLADRRRRGGSSARRCCATASASTTSRGSATSTSRSSTTSSTPTSPWPSRTVPPTGSGCCSTRRRAGATSASGAASPTTSSPGCPRSGCRASATCSGRSRRRSTTEWGRRT